MVDYCENLIISITQYFGLNSLVSDFNFFSFGDNTTQLIEKPTQKKIYASNVTTRPCRGKSPGDMETLVT